MKVTVVIQALLTVLILAMGGCKQKPAERIDTPGTNRPDGMHDFVISMFGTYPEKFQDKEINIYVEGKRIESRQSEGALKELRFTMDWETIQQAVSHKTGQDKNRLRVVVRLEPLSFEGEPQELPVIFDIRTAREEYVAKWGVAKPFAEDPLDKEDTNQKSKIN